ncbi:MAG: YlcI/YnfO family protein [Candidatus Dormibacteria bacterium]
MQRSRVTITVRPEVLAAAGEAVAHGHAPSLSAWVDQAMEEKVKRQELAELLAEMRAEVGPATADEDAWARQVLGL